ncbi:MAG TPA: CinA family nicotinamide mononucleotide deamidase-related protein [Anaerolineales bacterium]|nr:CinA family nicotinamide mononucleotide deamidase-related protein [Anaerolineales bacterium]
MSTTSSKGPSAEILTIGTELLLGDTIDTNTGEIARTLRRIGLDVFRTATVGDNAQRIARVMRESLGRADVVITTGGLGPTVDDPTREAAALALQTRLEFDDELWAEIQERFARFGRTPTENNRRQAQIPRGAVAILNPVGTAPAFQAETDAGLLICLPGVPSEMRWLMDNEVVPRLRQRFELPATLFTRIVRAAGVGESWLDEQIRDLEHGSDPTVGVMAHPGRVDIRIASKAASEAEALKAIEPVEAEIRRRLGKAVYGTDADTLEAATLAAVARRGWSLAAVERGTGGAMASMLSGHGIPVLVLGKTDTAGLDVRLAQVMEATEAQAGLAVAVESEGRRHQITMTFVSPDGRRERTASYGGPIAIAGDWAASLALDDVRRHLS